MKIDNWHNILTRYHTETNDPFYGGNCDMRNYVDSYFQD